MEKANTYYHCTDLFSVCNIMRHGLKYGNDGNIWIYSRWSLTNYITSMLREKKHIQKALSGIFQGVEPLRWRSLVDVGFGVIQINADGITGDFIPDRDGSKYMFGVKQKVIEPCYLSFLGKWDNGCLEVRQCNLRMYDTMYQEILKLLDKYNIKEDY